MPVSAQGDHAEADTEIQVVETHLTWPDVFRVNSAWARPIAIEPAHEDVLAITDIIVRTLYPDQQDTYVPFRMEHDADSQVWIVYYYALAPDDGEPMLGSGINIALDADTLQVLLVWYDE